MKGQALDTKRKKKKKKLKKFLTVSIFLFSQIGTTILKRFLSARSSNIPTM